MVVGIAIVVILCVCYELWWRANVDPVSKGSRWFMAQLRFSSTLTKMTGKNYFTHFSKRKVGPPK